MNTDLPMREIRRRRSWMGFLSPLSEAEMVALLRGASFVRLEDGEEMIVGPEEPAERMLLVVAGQLQVFEVSLSSEREFTLSVLGDGAAVGATGLVPRWTRDLHLRALEPSLVCSVGREDLEAVVRANPEVGIRLARTLANRLQLMEDRWADMVEKEVSQRLAGLIYMLVESVGLMCKEGPMIPTHYTHNQLASMVGSNREAVTRAFAGLHEVGAIEVKDRRVYVRDFDALRACLVSDRVRPGGAKSASPTRFAGTPRAVFRGNFLGFRSASSEDSPQTGPPRTPENAKKSNPHPYQTHSKEERRRIVEVGELLRTPSRRSPQNNPSTHSDELPGRQACYRI